MGEVKSGDEIRTEAIDVMGSPLGEIYHSLSDEVAWLHLKWNDFRELFANRDTVDLFNAAAPVFFYDLQRQTYENVLLHLCRITDPPQSSGKSNLTLQRLPALVSDSQLRLNLESLVKDTVNKTKFARDSRNRRLAHLELCLDGNAQPLPSATLNDFENALAAIRTLINTLEMFYLKTPVSYEDSIHALGGVAAFLAVLRKGVDARSMERDLRVGKHAP
jgi:hypothetical protein